MQEWFAVIGFVLVLAVVATERLHRTVAVLIGAAVFVLAGVLDQTEAFAAVDLSTIGLLIGMMVIVGGTERTGIFEQMAIIALRLSKGRSLAIVVSFATLTAVLSAFLDNLTAILLVAPMAIIVAARLRMEAAPLLIALIIASNIGGTATLIGDPPNIMIAGATGLTFNEFLLNLAPVAAVTFAVVLGAMYVFGRRHFAIAGEAQDIDDIQPETSLASGSALWVPVGILLLVLVGFVLHAPLHLEPATVALAGAAAMLLAGRDKVDETLHGIDWPTLFFFAGLFVMVGGLEQVGFLETVAEQTRAMTQGSRPAELLGIMWIAAIGSALVDNIPFTAAMIPVVRDLNVQNDNAYWWALSLGACFGGNATVVAAAANVACQGVAERNGIRLSFRQFAAWGIPVTLLSLVIATIYMTVIHA